MLGDTQNRQYVFLDIGQFGYKPIRLSRRQFDDSFYNVLELGQKVFCCWICYVFTVGHEVVEPFASIFY